MKKYFLVSTALAMLGAGAAMAADLPVKAPIVAAVPTCAQFGGLYVGGNVGYGYYDYRYNDKDALGPSIDTGLGTTATFSDSGWIGGVQAGWNWQAHCTVFGLEGDWSWTSLGKTDTFFDGDQSPAAAITDNVTIHSQLKSFTTLRARSGIVVDNLLLYVTGGFAGAKFNRSWTFFEDNVPTSATFTDNKWRWGWTAGVGSEWAWTPNLSVKSEFLYMRFDQHDFTVLGNGNIGAAGLPYRLSSEDSVWVTRIGLNYRFGGWGAPLLARY
jgi:outer membrane immunogenic protein